MLIKKEKELDMTDKTAKSAATDRLKETLISYVNTQGSLPWTDGLKYSNLSFDFGGRRASGSLYAGFNRVITEMQIRAQGFDSDIFLTGGEIKKRKGFINAGSKGTPVGYPCWVYEDPASGKKISEKDYQLMKKNDPDKAKTIKELFLGYKLYYVFNLAQTNIEHDSVIFASAIDIDENVEKASRLKTPDQLISSFPYKFNIETRPVKEPEYDTRTETLAINPVSFYSHPGFWYDEVFRQMAHITGIRQEQSSALKNDSRSVAKERIICQIASSLMMTLSGLDEEFFKANNSAYIKTWLDKFNALEGREVLDFFTLWNRACERVQIITQAS